MVESKGSLNWTVQSECWWSFAERIRSFHWDYAIYYCILSLDLKLYDHVAENIRSLIFFPRYLRPTCVKCGHNTWSSYQDCSKKRGEGIRVVGKGGWKNEKLKSFKLESLKLERLFKLERAKRSLKGQARSEKTEPSRKVSSAVGKFWLKLESLNELTALYNS